LGFGNVDPERIPELAAQGVARYRSTPDFRGAGTLLAPYPGGLRSCLAVLG
jgi:hypothetical protein